MAANDLLIAWLNDAYGMEQGQEKILERFSKDFEAFPEVEEGLKKHLEQTRQHQDDVTMCVESLGGSISTVKSALGSIMGVIEGMGTGMYKDEQVKNLLMIHAGEHFEHACYLALTEAARACGADNCATICESIAQEEKTMAEWTEQQLPAVVTAAVKQE